MPKQFNHKIKNRCLVEVNKSKNKIKNKKMYATKLAFKIENQMPYLFKQANQIKQIKLIILKIMIK